MIVVAVVDDNMGMMFNKRRQSKDRALRERILALAGKGKLWMNEYTYQQFSDCDTGGFQVDLLCGERFGCSLCERYRKNYFVSMESKVSG